MSTDPALCEGEGRKREADIRWVGEGGSSDWGWRGGQRKLARQFSFSRADLFPANNNKAASGPPKGTPLDSISFLLLLSLSLSLSLPLSIFFQATSTIGKMIASIVDSWVGMCACVFWSRIFLAHAFLAPSKLCHACVQPRC